MTGDLLTSFGDQVVTIDYTNHRGERGLRRILPLRMTFGSNKWHTTPQWLIVAVDTDKNDQRIFAVKDIHEWRVS